MWRKLLRPSLVKAYKLYLMATNRIKKALGINKRFGFLFNNKYIIHVSIVVLAVFVASTNLIQAAEVRTEDFQKETILHDIVKPDVFADDDIVETAASIQKADKSYIDTSAALVSNIPEIEEEQGGHEVLMTASGGSALVKSNIIDSEFGYTNNIREHIVEEGESIGSIAEDYNISVATIQWANGLGSSTTIQPGKALRIPPVSGVIYTIESGDTLLDVVTKREGDINEVREFNDIGDDDLIAVGTTIVIPGGQPYVPPAPAAAPSGNVASGDTSGSSSGWTSVFKPEAAPSAPASGMQFQWPSASHDISQYSRWGHVAIDIRGPMGTPIYASAAGTATNHSGGGYGNYVVIDHGNGWSTLYAHLSSYGVSSGQYVSQGQYIGGEGSTGWSTGPHLHFEIRQGGTKYNPLGFVK
ncbi:LysM peptidoglycan-binding domain-containing M23 family metallopeptidase [Patescibacteria group bacterium]|nr:LysM peptidoglycan-binding domain-containing M23 family metallopeptidase [Patescibacteria group bacterium]MBU1964135.1 LysM peptidoglycan-binding domain-containing M23 family metallopeptidase [Patescibacteria group bacterium]